MRNILKQTSWLFLAQSITRVIGFFYTIFLARTLGVSNFGLFSVALAYFSIISSVADFGFNRFLIREVVRSKERAPELLSHVIFLRLLLTSVFFCLFSVILYTLDSDKMRVSLTLLATLAILPQAVALTLDAIFVSIQNLKFSAISLFISSVVTTLAGVFLVGSGFGPIGAVNALIFGQVVYVFLLVVFLQGKGILKFATIKIQTLKQMLVGSLPYGLLGMLGLIYFRVDTILLSYLRGSFETGIYSAGYRFLEAVMFIPSSFSAALFPAIVKSSNLQISELYFKSLKIMGFLGLGLMLLFILVLPPAIKLFLPNYLSAIDVIRILAISIPFIFIATPAVQIMLSSEKHLKSVISLSLLTVAFNIILNLIFIPRYGFIAAAWITVLSEILSFIIFFLFLCYKILRR